MLSRDVKNTKKIQIERIDMKTTMYEMQSTLDWNNNRLNTAKRKKKD